MFEAAGKLSAEARNSKGDSLGFDRQLVLQAVNAPVDVGVDPNFERAVVLAD